MNKNVRKNIYIVLVALSMVCIWLGMRLLPLGSSGDIARRELDVPIEYEGLLDQYRTVILGMHSENRTQTAEAWINDESPAAFELGLFYEADYNASKENFGYGLKDMNHDGIVELVLLVQNSYNEPNVTRLYEIYTVCNGEMRRLDTFESRGWCRYIAEDGVIYTYDSESASNGIYTTRRISEGGERMIFIDQLATAPYSDEYCTVYWENEIHLPDGRIQRMDESEGILKRLGVDIGFPDNPAPGIDFIPLF